MKNQSKLKKIKEGKNQKKQMHPHEWFIMSRNPITASDLKELFDAAEDIEIWPELGVLEIVLGEKSSVDIEMLEVDLGDEYSNAYLKENQIKALFAVTFKEEDYDSAEPYLKTIAAGIDGIVCADTEDFTPVVR